MLDSGAGRPTVQSVWRAQAPRCYSFPFRRKYLKNTYLIFTYPNKITYENRLLFVIYILDFVFFFSMHVCKSSHVAIKFMKIIT